MINIRQATRDDEPRISEFLFKAYKEQATYKFPERWKWQFDQNPFFKGKDLPIFIALNEHDQVVGQICWMVEPIKIGDDYGKFLSWAVDLYVLPEYREQKLGFKLTKAILDVNPNLMALPMSEAFRHYMRRLNSMPLSPVSVYKQMINLDLESVQLMIDIRIKNLKLNRLFQPIIRFFLLDRIFLLIINLVIRIKLLFIKKRIDPKIQIEQVQSFDFRVNELWDTISHQFPVIIRRDCQFLNWKFTLQPYMNYLKYIAYRGDHLCGYIILRITHPPETNSGIIADLFVSESDDIAITTLLSHAIRVFRHEKVKYVYAASSVASYIKAFKRFGFRKQKDIIPLIKSKMDLSTNDIIFGKNAWFLSRSDHDWDQFPLG